MLVVGGAGELWSEEDTLLGKLGQGCAVRVTERYERVRVSASNVDLLHSPHLP